MFPRPICVGAALLAVTLSVPATVRAQAAAAAGEPLTLDEAVSRALDGNRSLAIARSEIDGIGDQLGAARTRRYPHLSARLLQGAFITPLEFTFPAGVFGTFPTTGPIPPAQVAVESETRFCSIALVSVVQPLTQLRRVGLGMRHLELERDLARERLDAEARAIRVQVKKAFHQLQRTEASLAATEDGIALAREVLRLSTAHREQRTVLAADLLAAESRLARAEHEQRLLTDAATALREQLNALMGRDLSAPFTVGTLPPPAASEASLEEAEAQALRERTELRQAALRHQQAENAVRLKREAYIPDVSVAVHYGTLGNVDVLPQQVFTAGVLLEWEPFTWGRVGREVDASKRAVARAELGTKEAEEAIRRDVRAAWRNLAAARRFVDVTAKGRQAAREQARVATERVRLEAGLVREALQAQAALAEADVQHDQALAGFWSALAEFERATGGGR